MSVMKAGEQAPEKKRGALNAERPAAAGKKQSVKKAEKKAAAALKAEEPVKAQAETPVQAQAAGQEMAAAKAAVPAEQEDKARTRRTSGLSKNLKSKLVFEFNGKQIDASAVMKRAEKEAVKKSARQVKTLEVYINAHENAAYYVVNGEGSDDYRIDL